MMQSGESDSQSDSKSAAKASSPAKAAKTSSVRPSRSGKAPRSQLHCEMFGESDSSDSDVISLTLDSPTRDREESGDQIGRAHV